MAGGMYVGVRTTIEPVWFVRWRNRLHGDPCAYPMEFRSQWWAQWNMPTWDPDRVRTLEMRIFAIVITAGFRLLKREVRSRGVLGETARSAAGVFMVLADSNPVEATPHRRRATMYHWLCGTLFPSS